MYPRIENGRVLKTAESRLCHKNVDKGEEVQWQGSPWIYQLSYHSRTVNVKINDNTLVK